MYRKNQLSRHSGDIVYAFVLLLIGFLLFFWYLSRFNWTDPEFGVIDMIYGHAYRPYVYRVLVPIIARLLLFLGPNLPLIYTSILMFLSLICFALVIRSFTISLWKSRIMGETASILSLIALIPFISRDGKIYDFTALFLFTLGLYFMFQKNWKLFLLVFFVGCVNKETTIFLTIVFVANHLRDIKNKWFWATLLSQGVIFLIVKTVLSIVFANNPGYVVRFQLRGHIYALTHNPYYLIVYGAFVICVGIFLLLDWGKKPEFLRISALSILIPVVIVNVPFAKAFEIRNYLDLYPLLFLLSVPTLWRIITAFIKPDL